MSRMRDAARRSKLAVKALGPWRGLRFAAQEMAGKENELLVGTVGGQATHRVWARPRSTDIEVYQQIFKNEEYGLGCWKPYSDHLDEHYQAILEQKRTPVIIDAGANAGYSSIWFSLEFPQSTILAVEPDDANFSMLLRNVAAFKNIIPLQAALWDEQTSVSLLDPNDWAWGRRFEAASGPGVPTVTVPELLGRDDRFEPFIMKIDIEGAETKLLRSNVQWVKQFPLIIFEPHDLLYHWLGPWQGSAHSFFSVLSCQMREYLTKGENIFAFLHPAQRRIDP